MFFPAETVRIKTGVAYAGIDKLGFKGEPKAIADPIGFVVSERSHPFEKHDEKRPNKHFEFLDVVEVSLSSGERVFALSSDAELVDE